MRGEKSGDADRDGKEGEGRWKEGAEYSLFASTFATEEDTA